MSWVKDRLKIGQERGRIRCCKDDYEYFDLTTFDKGLAIAKQLKVGRFMLKIDRDGPIFAGLADLVSHGSPSRSDGRGS